MTGGRFGGWNSTSIPVFKRERERENERERERERESEGKREQTQKRERMGVLLKSTEVIH